MSKAGSMAASMAWGFAIGGGVVGTLLGFYVPGIIGFILGTAVLVGSGWAAVHMTQASAGKGILAFLVAGVVAGIIGFVLVKMAASSAMSAAGGDAFKDAMQKSATQGGTQLTAEQQAQLSQVGNAMAGGLGALAGVMGFVWALLKTFLWGMIGCFIGGATKKSAVGASPAVSKAA
jgi:hypothetical protein